MVCWLKTLRVNTLDGETFHVSPTFCEWRKKYLRTEDIPLPDSLGAQSVYTWRSVNSLTLAVLSLVKNTGNEQMYYWGYPPRWVSEAYHLQLITSSSPHTCFWKEKPHPLQWKHKALEQSYPALISQPSDSLMGGAPQSQSSDSCLQSNIWETDSSWGKTHRKRTGCLLSVTICVLLLEVAQCYIRQHVWFQSTLL